MVRDLGVGPAALKCGVSAYARPSAMKALFETFVSRLLSPGELSALRHLLLEFRISRHHRCGLRKARGMSWSAPVKEGAGFQDVKRVSFDPSIDSQHREIGSFFISTRKPA
jgi:hypothetical protein